MDQFKPPSAAAYIASIGSPFQSSTFVICAEKEPLLRTSELSDAVILFLMLHYIFWMEYPTKCRCTCKFLQQQVLGRGAEEDGTIPVKLLRFFEKIQL